MLPKGRLAKIRVRARLLVVPITHFQIPRAPLGAARFVSGPTSLGRHASRKGRGLQSAHPRTEAHLSFERILSARLKAGPCYKAGRRGPLPIGRAALQRPLFVLSSRGGFNPRGICSLCAPPRGCARAFGRSEGRRTRARVSPTTGRTWGTRPGVAQHTMLPARLVAQI